MFTSANVKERINNYGSSVGLQVDRCYTKDRGYQQTEVTFSKPHSCHDLRNSSAVHKACEKYVLWTINCEVSSVPKVKAVPYILTVRNAQIEKLILHATVS